MKSITFAFSTRGMMPEEISGSEIALHANAPLETPRVDFDLAREMVPEETSGRPVRSAGWGQPPAAGLLAHETSRGNLSPDFYTETPGCIRSGDASATRLACPEETLAGSAVPSSAVVDAADVLHRSESASDFFRLRDIAAALGKSKKTVQRIAEVQCWPHRLNQNRLEFLPPADVAEIVAALVTPKAAPIAPAVQFATAVTPRGRVLALAREEAVQFLAAHQESHGKETALALTVAHFAQHGSRHLEGEPFRISTSSLRKWREAYALFGINGLVDQKQGRVGRKGVELPEELRHRGQALAHEHGSIARGARALMRDPRLPAEVRRRLHDAHASKSYVTPSIREQLRIAQLSAERLQGPRNARLQGRFTPGDYSQVRAGQVFTSDDMTSNVIVWCEWPNELGYRIGQPQILPVMDVATLRWLNVRVIMRHGGQYNAHDDIWGLFGDTFDVFGIPETFLLEGGHWQSNAVRGHRTGLTDDERIGGLSSVGVKIVRAYDPKGKAVIEGAFNQFQFECDRTIGYAGRDQRTQLPETLKAQLAAAQSGKIHPRTFLMHISEFASHVQAVMERLNHERQDGQILRGASPVEKWAEHNPQMRLLPDCARWLYRSAFTVTKITRNGVRIVQGSGAKQMVYYYDAPEHLTPRQGQTVRVFWNDANPDADAIILAPSSTSPDKFEFLCAASRVQPLQRFSATPEQLEREAKRKNAALQFARTEIRSIQPELARSAKPAAPVIMDDGARQIGTEIAAATERKREAARAHASLNAAIARTEVSAEDRAAALEASAPEEQPLSDDILAMLGDASPEPETQIERIENEH